MGSFFLSPAVAFSSLDGPDNLVIENVNLVEGDPVQAVSIVVTNGLLERVTTGNVRVDGHRTVDAEGGFLVGRLEIGSPPAIIIVKEDPTENFDMFWRIRENAVFALHDGQILTNTLPEIAEPTNDKPTLSAPWQNNEPIPKALPLRYWNSKPFNHWKTENSSGLFSAIIAIDRQRWPSQSNVSRSQVGDIEEVDGGYVRAFQFGVIGSIAHFDRPMSYMVFAASNEFDRGFDVEETDELSFVDYWLDVPIGDNSNLVLGRQKEPLSMERTISLLNIPLQERSAPVDAFLPSRNFGISLNGATEERKLTGKAGIYNNFIDSAESISNTSTEVAGRLTWVPWASPGDHSLLHLGLGLRYSTAEQGVRFKSGAEMSESPVFIDTGLIEADASLTSDLEIGWKWGPWWLQSEFLDARVDSTAGGNLHFRGHHLTASVILTGETRGYDRRYGYFTPFPVYRSVDHGGWGAVELATRWSHLDLNDGLVRGGELDVYSLGANWWLSPSLYLTLSLRRSATETLDGTGWTTGVLTRVSIILK